MARAKKQAKTRAPSVRLTHLDSRGQAHQVDVGGKPSTERVAEAHGFVRVSAVALGALGSGRLKKGDALAVARIAGIQGAKRTSELIPLCHAVPLTQVEVKVEAVPGEGGVRIRAIARARWHTGVEMEALTAVAAAALTLYDMLKSADRAMVIEGIRLVRKTGGASGDYIARD